MPIHDAETARVLLRDAKTRYSDATHVVHAFRTGSEGAETRGCSDDGEPSGTAGRPVLDVLSGGSGGGNALVLVIRYFGGVKLGTGGLVKAYGDTAKAVLALATWEELRLWVTGAVAVTWAEHRPLRTQVLALEGQVLVEEFGDGVKLEARVPLESWDLLRNFTTDLTRGRCSWIRLDAS